jgi:hypothetical protein
MVRYNLQSGFLDFGLSPGLRLAQPGGPTARVSVLPFLPEDILCNLLTSNSNFCKNVTYKFQSCRHLIFLNPNYAFQ